MIGGNVHARLGVRAAARLRHVEGGRLAGWHVVPLHRERDAVLRSRAAVRVDDFCLRVIHAGSVLRYRVGLVSGAGSSIDPESGSTLETRCRHVAGELVTDRNAL